jgi:predicted GIY-YIG superfamily endonuclease
MPDAEASTGAIAFLQKYAPVENGFIEDFFGLLNDADVTAPHVDLDTASKWLGVPKFNLMKTLKASYSMGSDFTVSKPPVKLAGRGRNTRRMVLLMPDCFKMLCMQSKSPRAHQVREYYLAVEKTLLRYRQEIVDAMEQRIRQLEANQRPLGTSVQRTGVLYVLRSPDGGMTRYKLGQTSDLMKRLQSHNSAVGDRLEIVFVYKTENMVQVEACVKAVLKKHQYAKYKEVYEADLDVIKHAITSCGELCTRIERISSKRRTPAAQLGGGGVARTFVAMLYT